MQIKLDKQKKYLLACSFGPDSMALFNMLLEGGYNFGVVHINYMMRGQESEEETKSLIKLLKEKNIKYYANYIDGKILSGNFQTKAREVRYSFFSDVMLNDDYDVLLTGHHKDDFLETYLLSQKSNRKSFYYGIKDEVTLNGVKVLRPLLSFYKEELLRYCNEHNVPYAIDSSNLGRKYARNKIRHDVLMKMTVQQKDQLFNEVQELNNNLEIRKQELLKLIEGNRVSITKFNELSEDDQSYLLYIIFDSLGFGQYFHSSKVKLIKTNMNSAKTSTFMKVVNELFISKYEDDFYLFDLYDYRPYEYTLKAAKSTSFPQFDIIFNEKTCKMHIKEEHFPITITVSRGNETYIIDGHKKKMNRVFIDMKMPRHIRLIWPVVKGKDGTIIYVPRYRKGYKPKETDLFKINQV